MELKSGRSNLDETFDTGYKSYIDDDILLKQPFQNLLRRQDEYIEQLEKENGILKVNDSTVYLISRFILQSYAIIIQW